MSDTKAIAALQRQAAEAEVERLRLVGELEDMRERAEKAEAQLASITGVTRLELVAAERAKRDGLLAAFKTFADAAQGFDVEFACEDSEAEAEAALADARAAIAAAEAA